MMLGIVLLFVVGAIVGAASLVIALIVAQFVQPLSPVVLAMFGFGAGLYGLCTQAARTLNRRVARLLT